MTAIQLITRLSPVYENTSAEEFTFLVTFTDTVQNVSADDFQVTGGSTASIVSVNLIGLESYKVKVGGGNLGSYLGLIGIELKTGTDIRDLLGNPLTSVIPNVNETYTRKGPPFVEINVLEPESSPEIFRGRAYYRVRFEVVNTSENMPREIFVHQLNPSPSPKCTTHTHNEFIAVAGPLDLVNIPVGAPNVNYYHRLSTADLLIESVSLVEVTVNSIRESVQQLVDGLRQLDNLKQTTNMIIG